MKRAVIIGAGMGGLIPAFMLRQAGWEVVIIEKESYTGGGVRTFFHGGHPYTFGPRHFLSPFPEAYEWLVKYVPLRDLKKINYTFMESDQTFYTYPIHDDDIDKMPEAKQIRKELSELPEETQASNFEEFWIGRVGETLYNKYVKHYNKKAWQIESNTVNDFGFEGTVKRKPLETGDRYEFRDWYNCYPVAHDGYNQFFDMAVEGCDLRLNTKITGIDVDACTVHTESEKISGDILISTTSPDYVLNNQFGELKYVGRDFFKIVLPIEEIFPEDVYFVYYPNESEQQTRVVEYKKLTLHKSPHTLLGMEVPSMKNKLYPTMIKSEVEKAQKYLDALPDNVYSMGRMGKYRYIDIDDLIIDSLEFMKNL